MARARALLAELSVARAAAGEVNRFTRARARREHAASELGPGAAKEKRASGLGARAPHPRAVPVSSSPSLGRLVCLESRWQGCLHPAGAGAAR